MKRIVHAFKVTGAVVLAGLAGAATAQTNLALFGEGRFLVNTPSSIAGVKSITTSISSQWGGSLSTPIINRQVVRALGTANNNTDSLLCSTAANGTGSIPALTNRVAILFRGNCQFSEKAYAAQQAGASAVIIVNNIPGAPVGMASGTNGAAVTIPVVMVSDVDGQAMVNAIRNGQTVNVTMGEWSLGLAADLGLVPHSNAMPHARAIPLNQLNGTTSPAAYRFYTGGIFSNFGTSTQTNIKVKQTINWTPTGGTTSTVYTDSAVIASLTPQDSSDIAVSTRFYNPQATVRGRYTTMTRVSSTTGDADSTDNMTVDTLVVTDTIFSKGTYDFNANRPSAIRSYRFNTGTSFSWGPLFYVAKGGQYPRRVQFTLSPGTGLSLDGKAVTVAMFKWTDGASGYPTDGIMQEGEMSLKGLGQRSFTTADSGFADYSVTMQPISQTAAQPQLEDNSWYWYGVSTDGSLYVGVDDNINPFIRMFASKAASTTNSTEYQAPIYTSDYLNIISLAGNPFQMLPFISSTNAIDSVWVDQRGLVPAVAVHVSNSAAPTPPQSVAAATVLASSLELFPNPTADNLSIKWTGSAATKNITFTVFNGVGQAVMMRTLPQTAGTNNTTLSLASLPAGSYLLVAGSNDGIETRAITVAR